MEHYDWLEKFEQPIRALQTSVAKINMGNFLLRIGPRTSIVLKRFKTLTFTWAVVVAQLVARLLPTPVIRGSNPVISNIIYYQLNCIKDKK